MGRWIIFALALALLVAPLTAEASNGFPYGECTYWAVQMRPDLIGVVYGDARFWADEARWAGYGIAPTPRVGEIAVIQPGVQEADWQGHVAYVTAVGTNGWFQVSQMHWPWLGAVNYHWFHTGWGVAFIGWR